MIKNKFVKYVGFSLNLLYIANAYSSHNIIDFHDEKRSTQTNSINASHLKEDNILLNSHAQASIQQGDVFFDCSSNEGFMARCFNWKTVMGYVGCNIPLLLLAIPCDDCAMTKATIGFWWPMGTLLTFTAYNFITSFPACRKNQER